MIGKPKAGETVVVSAASGAVGSVVGQLARLHGCRAVGIAGGKDKCDYVVKELGFDACVDYRAAGANLFKELRAAAPKGIDVYFENVGGAVQAAVLPQLNDFARVPLCGLISQYNEMQMSPGPDWRLLLVKRATVTGFIVSDHFGQMEGFWKEVPAAVKAGTIKYREDIVKGIENAPEAFMGLLKGKNFGKLLVQVVGGSDAALMSQLCRMFLDAQDPDHRHLRAQNPSTRLWRNLAMSGMSAPTSTVAADGVRLATYEWGNPAGPALVLVHGFAQCHLCFAPQVESELARDFRIVAYDLRGHGASDKPTDARAYQGSEVWAKDLAAVLAAKKLERPVLVGWSMGGRMIRQYLMNYGDAAVAGLNFVASLVIEDTALPGSRRPEAAGARATAGRADRGGDRFPRRSATASSRSESEFRVALAYNMLVPAHVRLAISGWSTDPAETVVALKRVRVPTLVTQGRKDAVVLPAAAEMTAAAIPGAELSWFDDCGHSPFSEDAPRFNAELAQFMARAAASRS